MAESLIKEKREFWNEVKRTNRSSKTIPSNIDGIRDAEGITKLFKQKFGTLYSSVPSSEHDLNSLADRIAKAIPPRITANTTFSVTDIERAILKLKKGKADGHTKLQSDCLKHAPKRLHVWICALMNSMLVHGFSPYKLLIGTMTPIPKSRNCTLSSDKYRAITLISCLIKLFDYIVLDRQKNIFKTDALQFGFKDKCSTTLCSVMMTEICRIFNSQGSKVFSVLLDATKAFDRLEFSTLFNILLDRGMNPFYVRCLWYMYLNQELCIQWNGILSDHFPACNGVKQGGVMSPLLFGIYLDSLIENLRKSGYGCFIGPHFVGCLAYADDIVILSPTKQGLKNMLVVCEKFSQDYKLTFNGTKSQFIVFEAKAEVHSTNMNVFGVHLPNAGYVEHLGHKIYADPKRDDLEGVISAFYRQFNNFRSKFGHVASVAQAELFQSYCSSFYGSILLPFRKMDKLNVVWRKSLRQVWRLPWRCHNRIVACLAGKLCCQHMLISRFINFAAVALHHPEDVVKAVLKRSLTMTISTVGRNLIDCCRTLGITS